jgi:hypothetical protein
MGIMSELKVSPPVKVPPEPKLETAPRGYWKGSLKLWLMTGR